MHCLSRFLFTFLLGRRGTTIHQIFHHHIQVRRV